MRIRERLAEADRLPVAMAVVVLAMAAAWLLGLLIWGGFS